MCTLTLPRSYPSSRAAHRHVRAARAGQAAWSGRPRRRPAGLARHAPASRRPKPRSPGCAEVLSSVFRCVQQVQAVDVGQVHVQQDQVRAALAQGGQARPGPVVDTVSSICGRWASMPRIRTDIGLVVLDVVHMPAPVRLRRPSVRARRRLGVLPDVARGRRSTKVDPWPAPAAGLQRAAHQLGQTAADDEPDAGAFDRPSSRGRAG